MQLALFWHGCPLQERNAYANVLVFLVLSGEDLIAPAAFEVIVYDIIKNPSTPLPWSAEAEDDFRDTVAAAVMEKLRAEGIPRGQTKPRPWRHLASYQRDHDVSTGNFRAWLRRVAYTTAVDINRRHPMSVGSKGNRRWLRPVSLDDWDEGAQALDHWRAQPSLPMRLDMMRHLSEVADRLRHLPEKERDALCLRVDSGFGYRQMAQLLGCTPEAVRKRLARARRHLMKSLDLFGS